MLLTRRCQYSLSCDADLEIETLEPTLASLSRDSELATEAFAIGRDSKPSGKNAFKLAAFGCMVLQHLYGEDAGLSDELEALRDLEAMLRPETGLILLPEQEELMTAVNGTEFVLWLLSLSMLVTDVRDVFNRRVEVIDLRPWGPCWSWPETTSAR
ncbi:hypothetical protein FLAG1_11001 [Fusarium langsethiae]|uniref:Uncharacterized protein n=1 Tax=Fusarium langsethiae TaxID=179993 RepID=A0A0N0DB47_FUSLA|nr:hypothetical protein FLAG1_11001 [Fusarium langsethiae]